jgi:O-antigen/teichoic acid export membrane protein
MKTNLLWAGLLRGVVRVLTLAKTVILARILTPFQFGVFGIASLILGLLEMLTETGVNVVLVQERKNIDKYINTAWVVSICRGILIFALIILFTPFITGFFDNTDAANILYLTSLIPLIRGFINPSIVKYQKNLEFNREFKFRSILIFLDVVVSVTIGFIYKTELALVAGMIFAAVAEVVMSFVLIKPKPSFEFDKSKLIEVINRGKWITGAKIFDYLFSHGDDIVVGKLLGSVSLGLYQQAYKISSLPIVEVAEVFQRVTFPYYSKYAVQKDKLLKTYLKTLRSTLLLILPFGILIYLFPEVIITTVLGPSWIQAAGALKILAIFGVVKTLVNSVFPLLLGIGRQDLVTYLTLIGVAGLSITIYPLIGKYGIEGAGLATIIGSLLMLPPAIYWLKKVTNA